MTCHRSRFISGFSSYFIFTEYVFHFYIIIFTGDVICIILLFVTGYVYDVKRWICLWGEGSVAGARTGADPAYSWPTPGDNGIRGAITA